MPFNSDLPQNFPRAKISAVRMPSGKLNTMAQNATFNESATAVHSSALSESQSVKI
jgi:hypothetical protein